MAKISVKKKCLISISTILLLTYVFLLCCYNGKKVHLSIDDVSISMKDLTSDSLEYSSILEQSFFRKLHFLHRYLGAKFTLYVYANDGSYDIDNFPCKYKYELQSYSWLRFGYHAQSPMDSIPNFAEFKDAYNKVDSNLLVKLGGHTKTLRLHYFYASYDIVKFLKEKGIATLLSADDNRISYSLSKDNNGKLIAEGVLYYDGINYMRTDIRVERDNIVLKLFTHCFDKELVVFAHEWALCSKRGNWVKLGVFLFILKILGCDFIIQ